MNEIRKFATIGENNVDFVNKLKMIFNSID